jgi:hypothetical protein
MSTTLLPGTETYAEALAADPAAYLDHCKAEAEAFAAGFSKIRAGQVHATGFAACHGLTVASVSYGTPPEEVAAAGDEALVEWVKTAETVGAVLTEDGRIAHSWLWHEGPATGDSVRFEVYTATEDGLRQVHGYVDPTSRRVVQYG